MRRLDSGSSRNHHPESHVEGHLDPDDQSENEMMKFEIEHLWGDLSSRLIPAIEAANGAANGSVW